MAKHSLLFSWIGTNDLLAMSAEVSPADQKRVLDALKTNREPQKHTGPIKTLVKQERFDEIHLLSNYPKFLNQLFLNWLGTKISLHDVSISDPTDYAQILNAVDKVLGTANIRADSKVSFFLTPGTPSMAATWILVGKSRYDAIFWQSFQGKATKSTIPFDVVAGFASELASVPDMNLQHLAANAPSEIEGFERIAGSSKDLKLAAGRAAKAARRDVPVLILGDSGTGKEMFAEAIHNASRRKTKPFIRINCAAIPDTLLESALFGHTKGAFSDAKKDHPGAFQQADGGTLFLDEVGECSPLMQAALLRVLQPPDGKGPCHREFSPVGDVGKRVVANVRILSATNRDLVERVQKGDFREDLFYRLAVIKVKLPPLRNRKADLPALVDILLEGVNRDFTSMEPGYRHKTISDSVKRFVRQYEWPGNIRQLKNTIVEAAVMCDGNIIQVGDIKAAIADVPSKQGSNFEQELGDGFCLQTLLETVQREYLTRAMEQAEGVKTRAAELLGMASYQTLDAQMKRLKVVFPKSRSE